jgi:hypothetical protein
MRSPVFVAMAATLFAGFSVHGAARADDLESPRTVAFRAEAKVTLDAAGHPLAIEPSADLPGAIRDFIKQRVATWHFSPPEQGGATGPAVTYLRLGACAIPQPDGNYRMALDFKGNGPLYANGPMMLPPAYPKAALVRRIGADAKVVYIVEGDGSATLDRIEYADGGNHRADGIDATLREWVRGMRYQPEQLAGHPVRTRVRVPVTFRIAGRDFTREGYREELHQQAAKSDECRLAAGAQAPAGLQPLALDSPVKIEPVG